MRFRSTESPALLAALLVALCAARPVCAQKHNGGSSPPTPPPSHTQSAIAAANAGMGPLQFQTVDYGVPSPASLTRQLQIDDERMRASALAAIGAPAQYLAHGHIAMPRSVQLDVANLSNGDEEDAIVTAELDQHIVSAVLIPEEANWRRVATVTFPTSFNESQVMLSNFLRVTRSTLQKGHYRAIFRSLTTAAGGDYTENEGHLRLLNGRAVMTISFVSASRVCASSSATDGAGRHAQPGCDLTQRWLTPDTAGPGQHVILVTATGHLTAHEAADPLARSRIFETAHLHSFTCQPYQFSDATDKYEPAGSATPCGGAK